MDLVDAFVQYHAYPVIVFSPNPIIATPSAYDMRAVHIP